MDESIVNVVRYTLDDTRAVEIRIDIGLEVILDKLRFFLREPVHEQVGIQFAAAPRQFAS